MNKIIKVIIGCLTAIILIALGVLGIVYTPNKMIYTPKEAVLLWLSIMSVLGGIAVQIGIFIGSVID